MFISEMTPSQQIKAFLAARSCDQATSQTPQLSSSIEMTLTPPSEPSERSQPSPPSVEPPKTVAKIVSDSDEGEARRIAGELLKMKQDGGLDGPQDPEAEFAGNYSYIRCNLRVSCSPSLSATAAIGIAEPMCPHSRSNSASIAWVLKRCIEEIED